MTTVRYWVIAALVAYNMLVLASHGFRLFVCQAKFQLDHRTDPLRITDLFQLAGVTFQ
jgi:hypothetical protein